MFSPFWTTLDTRILCLHSVYSVFWFFSWGEVVEAEHLFFCNSYSGVSVSTTRKKRCQCVEPWPSASNAASCYSSQVKHAFLAPFDYQQNYDSLDFVASALDITSLYFLVQPQLVMISCIHACSFVPCPYHYENQLKIRFEKNTFHWDWRTHVHAWLIFQIKWACLISPSERDKN
jgi:hypothetical protein